MHRPVAPIALSLTASVVLTACGGGGADGGGGPPPPPALTSYLGTTNAFAAWANASNGDVSFAPIGSYAGKRQSLRGTIDYLTGENLGQAAGVEVYKGADGQIHALDLTVAGTPQPQTLSSESAATVDDTCTYSGTAVAGANYDYVGVYFTADLVNPVNSTYVYRLPGPDGVCGTADDVIHAVKTGMSATSAPITATGMPLATVRTAQGGIAGFVIKSGASLVEVDSNFANPIVLGTYAAPIGVAAALPTGTTQGYPTGQLYVVDGNIVYVNYAQPSVSAPLYAIPRWTPTTPIAIYAASPTTLYFAVNNLTTGGVPASAAIYAMPSDGSAPPTLVDTEAGHVLSVAYPVAGNSLLFGVATPTYQVRALSGDTGTVSTVVATASTGGTFTATAASVYWTAWTVSYDSTTATDTHSATQSGISALDGSVIAAPLANSSFASGGEQVPWPQDTVTTATPYQTVFRIQGLHPVTVMNAKTGETFVWDGVSGGTVVALDTTSNQPGATIGIVPNTTATSLTGSFRSSTHAGFLQATTPASTQGPATLDLFLLNSRQANTLTPVTSNL